jgi:hypothetical protein
MLTLRLTPLERSTALLLCHVTNFSDKSHQIVVVKWYSLVLAIWQRALGRGSIPRGDMIFAQIGVVPCSLTGASPPPSPTATRPIHQGRRPSLSLRFLSVSPPVCRRRSPVQTSRRKKENRLSAPQHQSSRPRARCHLSHNHHRTSPPSPRSTRLATSLTERVVRPRCRPAGSPRVAGSHPAVRLHPLLPLSSAASAPSRLRRPALPHELRVARATSRAAVLIGRPA